MTELEAEQAVLDRAHLRLEAMRAAARAVSEDVLDQGAGGTHSARLERDVRVAMTVQRLAQLRGAEAGLVFGRTDHDDGEVRHVGRQSVDDEGGDPLVVDWRAPAAEPFYRATGRNPMGVVRRRHLVVQGRKVVGLDDELLGSEHDDDGLVLMGGASLLAALGRARTGRMSDIVATIQREQDEIIRAPLPGVLVVQGGPGTGKTAIALHRAAYLLYTHRFPLERAGVLLIGPNPVHLRYIEAVLPALGEDAVTLATPSTLGPAEVSGTEDADRTRLKGDPRMASVLARAVADRGRPLARAVSVLWKGQRLTLTRDASRSVVTSARRRPNLHNPRRRLVERLVLRHLTAQAGSVLDDAILEERPLVEALERMWPVLSPEELLHDLFGSAALLRRAAGDLLEAAEAKLLERPRSARVDAVRWTAADAALLDEAAGILGPPPGGRRLRRYEAWNRTWGHVLVDEAQDLSPMQVRMLARHCPGRSMTLAGDLAQASGAWGPSSWDEILVHLGLRREPRLVELTVNYRTPAEIMELAARVLAEAEPAFTPSRALRRSGDDPQFTAASRGALAASLAAVTAAEREETGEGTLAVIVPEGLLDLARAALPGAGEGTRLLDSAVALLTPTDAKGLEFDTVVVVEPAAIVAESPQGFRALYLVLSRSTRRLHVVHAEPLPPPLDPAVPGVACAGPSEPS